MQMQLFEVTLVAKVSNNDLHHIDRVLLINPNLLVCERLFAGPFASKFVYFQGL
jgi:hypothetical protein